MLYSMRDKRITISVQKRLIQGKGWASIYDLVTLGTTKSGGKYDSSYTILYKEHSLSYSVLLVREGKLVIFKSSS